MSSRKLKLGLFGFGCVGQGLYTTLSSSGFDKAEIKKICIKNIDKKRSIDAHYFTNNPNELLDDSDIDVIVELIDDAESALNITTRALKNGKAVVTANKKLVAENLAELIELQKATKTPILYEGACCASIPIIRNLEEYYDNDLVSAVQGIFNGSTNYILSSIEHQSLSFELALTEAQEKGFAETDPTLDIEGYDAKYKLCIILAHAFGKIVAPTNVYQYGISQLNNIDINYANEKSLSIKLLARCYKNESKIHAYVIPRFVEKTTNFSRVSFENNGVEVEGAFSEQQFFIGKGAGSLPTGAAVLSDISALTYDYKYEYKKINKTENLEFSNDYSLWVYISSNHIDNIPLSGFSEITSLYNGIDACYVKGKIQAKELFESNWIKNKNISIIELAQSEIEQLEAKQSSVAVT